MLGRGRGNLPIGAGTYFAWANVPGLVIGEGPGKLAAAPAVGVDAQRMIDTGNKVVGESTVVFVDKPVGNSLGESGSVNLQVIFIVQALVPSGQQETWVVQVVVRVVMGKEQVVNLRGPETRANAF